MKKVANLILFSIVFVLFNNSLAQQSQQTRDSISKKNYADSVKKIYADSIKKAAGNTMTTKADATSYGPKEITSLIVVIAFFLVMILLLLKFFAHLKDNNQRIGYQSIKLIGLILIFPGVCILALIGGKEILSGETFAVLLGTIAGYVLSREDDNKDSSSFDARKKKEEESQAKIKALEETIKSIKEKNPNLIV